MPENRRGLVWSVSYGILGEKKERETLGTKGPALKFARDIIKRPPARTFTGTLCGWDCYVFWERKGAK